MKRLLAHLVLALSLASTAAAVPVKAADEPYDIYVIAGLTGSGAYVGHGVQLALQAGEKYVNATGGIGGRPVHFVILDDQTSPQASVEMANQLIAKHVPVFLGPVGAATCTAVQPLLDRNNGPVSYCLSNAMHPAAGSYMFSAQLSTKDFAGAALRYLDAKGLRKIALLTSTDAAGQDGVNIVEENLKEPDLKNVDVVANEHFGTSDLSVRAQIARIKASGAQVIDAWTTGPAFGTILHGVQEAGWDGVVLTNGANINKNLIEGYAAVMPHDLIFTGPPYMAVSGVSGPVRAAKDVYLKEMRQVGVESPDLTQMLGWDPMLIVVDALRRLGTGATAAQIHDYIENLHGFAGVNGYYDFRHGDQRGLDPRTSVVVRWDPSGDKFVTVSRPGGRPL